MAEYKPFMSRKEAAEYTGFSYCSVRKGTLDGSIPCKMVGNKHYINMALWLKQLESESRKSVVNG